MREKSRTQEEIAARVKALESMLIERRVVTTEAIDRLVEIYENEVGPQFGAQAVAKAWSDGEFKAKLMENATEACRELGITGFQGDDMSVVENSDDVHNVIVCTLCSCYPYAVLGMPPNWYKEPQFRARIVREPRTVLGEDFRFPIPESTEIRVWDSSADTRFWVLPKRPEGTDGWSEEQLMALVTRDSMIGVGPTAAPLAE